MLRVATAHCYERKRKYDDYQYHFPSREPEFGLAIYSYGENVQKPVTMLEPTRVELIEWNTTYPYKTIHATQTAATGISSLQNVNTRLSAVISKGIRRAS